MRGGTFVLGIVLAAGCTEVATLPVGGTLSLTRVQTAEGDADVGTAVEVEVTRSEDDPEAGSLTFTWAGAQVGVTFDRLDPSLWVEGCPTQTSVSLMETASLRSDQVEIGDHTLDEPTVVATCSGASGPADGLVIRGPSDDELGPCGTADTCLWFTR